MTGASRSRARAAVASLVRSGPRTVMLTPTPGPRLGNFLYFWLHAHVMRRAGRPFAVQTPDYMDEWLDLLPKVRSELSVRPRSLRVRDRRVWPNAHLHQRYGVDFDDEDLATFVDDYLLGTPLLSTGSEPSHDVVVNVRRGDYYATARNRADYGFDVVDYVTKALSLLSESEPVSHVHVVSDDPQWCRAALADPLSLAVSAVSFSDPADSAPDNFRALTRARRLVGSNSTFAYWAAYVLGRTQPDEPVIMPSLHARSVHGGNAFQLLPSWHALEVLPEPTTTRRRPSDPQGEPA